MLLLSFVECQDLIAQCLQIDASQRLLLEDVLRHPWMRMRFDCEKCDASTPVVASSCPQPSMAPPGTSSNGVACYCRHSVAASSEATSGTVAAMMMVANNMMVANTNQHKPSLNSVGSCVSSSTSTDECLDSPQHTFQRLKVTPRPRLRPPNSAPQASRTTAAWILLPQCHLPPPLPVTPSSMCPPISTASTGGQQVI
jgi:serine/threonine protein kinase